MASKEEQIEKFKSFDFDSNEEWRAHLRNVELPASGTDVALVKVKAKWYKKVVDPEFDPTWAAPASAGLGGTSTTGTASSNSPGQEHSDTQWQSQPEHHAPHSSRSSPWQPVQPAGARATRDMDNKTLSIVSLQGLVLVLTVLYLQPFQPVLSSWSYNTLFTAVIVLQMLKLHQSYGLPVAWNLSSISLWARPLLTSSDAHYLILAVGARLSAPVTAALPSYFVLALYSVAFFLSEHYSRHPLWRSQGAKFYQLMMKYQQHALLFNAQNEIMLGFMMLVMVLMPRRQVVLLMVVWNFLRMRYWSTDGSWYHKQIWGMLEDKTRSWRQRFPLLQKIADFGVNFFNQARPQPFRR